jgi:hypothetical protein
MYKASYFNLNTKLFFISFLFFSIKWFFSIYEYGLENILIKVIFNPSGDYSYFPFVYQLSNLNLNEGYSVISENNKLIGFPFLVSIFHAIFFKFFGLYSFLIIELLSIFIFLKIFSLIFDELKIEKNFSILLAIIFFSLLPISNFLYQLDFNYSLNLKNLYSGFYSLRFPRPLITNLFFFGFLCFTLKFYLEKNHNIKNRYLLFSFVFLGFLFSSFFYFFLLSALLLFITLLLNYKKNIMKFDNIVFLSKYLLIFILISLLFIYQLIFIEKDYYARIGTILLSPENKLFLYNHLFDGFFKKEFLFIFFINIILGIFNFLLNSNIKKFFIFFNLVFLSSILVPFVYLFMMNQITFFSNFVFIITLSSLLLLKINLIGIFMIIIKFNFLVNFKNLFLLFSFCILIFFNLIYFKETSKVEMLSQGIHFNSNKGSSFRKDFKDLIYNLDKIDSDKKLLLTNDVHTQLWWILNGNEKFYFPYVFFVALKDDLIEKQLFNAFKILNLNFDDFLKFFNQNKVTDWRIVNTNNYFFLGHLKYQANYLTKYNDYNQYPEKTQEFIKKKSIHHTNQVILSRDDIDNFKKKFENYKLNPDLNPDLIVIFKNELIERNISELKRFKIIYENSNYVALINN